MKLPGATFGTANEDPLQSQSCMVWPVACESVADSHGWTFRVAATPSVGMWSGMQPMAAQPKES